MKRGRSTLDKLRGPFSSQAQEQYPSRTDPGRHIMTGGSARAKRGVPSWRTKLLLFAPGLILRFRLTRPASLRMTQIFVSVISSHPLTVESAAATLAGFAALV